MADCERLPVVCAAFDSDGTCVDSSQPEYLEDDDRMESTDEVFNDLYQHWENHPRVRVEKCVPRAPVIEAL